jgi:hypothetical protein
MQTLAHAADGRRQPDSRLLWTAIQPAAATDAPQLTSRRRPCGSTRPAPRWRSSLDQLAGDSAAERSDAWQVGLGERGLAGAAKQAKGQRLTWARMRSAMARSGRPSIWACCWSSVDAAASSTRSRSIGRHGLLPAGVALHRELQVRGEPLLQAGRSQLRGGHDHEAGASRWRHRRLCGQAGRRQLEPEIRAVVSPDVLAVGLLPLAFSVVVWGLADLVLGEVDVDLAGIVVDPVDDPGR